MKACFDAGGGRGLPLRGFVATVLLLCFGCGSEPALEPLVDPVGLDEAEWSVQERYRELRGRADAALEAESPDPERLLKTQSELGRWLFATRYSTPARAALRNAERLDPSDRQWPYLLARLARQAGDQTLQRRHLERTLELDGDYAPALVALAELEIGGGNTERAREILSPLAARGVAPASYKIAKLDIERGDFEGATAALRQVVASQPGATAAHQLLAIALRSSGQEEQAREHMKLAMAKDSNAARSGEGLREPTLADPIVGAAQVLRTDSRRLLEQANQAVRQGRHRQAVELFERALQAAPEAAAPRIRYSNYLAQHGRGPRALALLSEALSLDPDDNLSRYRLAALLVKSGQRAQAIPHLEEVIGEDPRNAAAHILLAEQYRYFDRKAEAVSQLESLLVVDPSSLSAVRQLIRYHYDSEDCDPAVTQADRAAQLHREDPTFVYWKAWIGLWCGTEAIAVRNMLEEHARSSTALSSGMVDALWAQTYAHALARAGRRSEAVSIQSDVLEVLDKPRDVTERTAASERLSAYRRGEWGPRSLPQVGADRFIKAPPSLTEGR